MSDLIPSVLLYGQALDLLEEIEEARSSGLIKDGFELTKRVMEALTRFQESAGEPLLDYEYIVDSEPPSSEKMNRFWQSLEKDMALLRQQLDMLQAATVFTHNTITTEINRSQLESSRLTNKVNSLQMYSDSYDSTIISFGDSFKSLEFIDLDLTPRGERVNLPTPGYITLGQRGEAVDISNKAKVKVLDSSNGFIGNNQEVEDPDFAPIHPVTGNPDYMYKAESMDVSDLSAIIDSEPGTWLEYERYRLSESAKQSAGKNNFFYTTQTQDEDSDLVDWASPPPGNILKLDLEFDFENVNDLNLVAVLPYGLSDNINHPILIRDISLSPNGTDWVQVFPTRVWIATDINIRVARATDNTIAHIALWAFENRPTRYVRIRIEQPKPIASEVGYTYWVDKNATSTQVHGPNPPSNEPTRYHDQRRIGDIIQQRGFLEGHRWVIGLRDIAFQQVHYVQRSSFVTKRLRAGGDIERVVLEDVDLIIPESYDKDRHWVRFYISPDDGENWYQIARMDDPVLGIPQQISFNNPLHESLRERFVQNYETEGLVSFIRMKVEIERPEDLPSATPVLQSFRLKVKIR